MTNLQQVIQKLKSQGKTETEITTVVESLTKLALVKYTSTLVETVKNNADSEEIAMIEKLTDDVEREKKTAEFYQKQTGQTLDQLATSKLEEAAAEFLKQ